MASWKTIKTALKRNEFAFRLLHPLHKVYRMAFMWTAQRRLGVNPRKIDNLLAKGKRMMKDELAREGITRADES